jgi:hypothetical protein
MIIDRDTTIKQLLDADQERVIDSLIRLNSNFKKLRNPFLRKLLAKRVSVAEACRIGKCQVHDFLTSMKEIGFDVRDEHEIEPTAGKAFEIPSDDKIIELDVRPILAENKDPLKQILSKLTTLSPDQYLKLINTFEPFPLINLLAGKGFSHYVDVVDENCVITYLFKPQNGSAIKDDEMEEVKFLSNDFDELLQRFSGKVTEIDVTAFEMPRPMHMILDAVAVLKKDEALFVHHKKVPVYLLPHLHDQGVEYLIGKKSESEVSILIYK